MVFLCFFKFSGKQKEARQLTRIFQVFYFTVSRKEALKYELFVFLYLPRNPGERPAMQIFSLIFCSGLLINLFLFSLPFHPYLYCFLLPHLLENTCIVRFQLTILE